MDTILILNVAYTHGQLSFSFCLISFSGDNTIIDGGAYIAFDISIQSAKNVAAQRLLANLVPWSLHFHSVIYKKKILYRRHTIGKLIFGLMWWKMFYCYFGRIQTKVGTDERNVSQRGGTIAYISGLQYRVYNRWRSVLRQISMVPHGWQVSNKHNKFWIS